MKKIICMLLITILSVFMLSACGKDEDTSINDNKNVKNITETDDTGKSTDSGKLNDVYQAVKSAYGEEYLPNMAIDDDKLVNTYGINMDDVAEYKAEVPMVSTNIDTFIGIEAKEGRADAVEQALNNYRNTLINDTDNTDDADDADDFNENQYKAQASRVVRSGNYVFFVMLGDIDDDLLDDDSDDNLKAEAEQKTQKAVDAINSTLNK